MRILLTFFLFCPMLVSANQQEQHFAVKDCVYITGNSICYHGDSYQDKDGFVFDIRYEFDTYNLERVEDATRTR